MITFGNAKSKSSINPKNILGAIGFYKEESFEKETSSESIVATAFDAVVSLVTENVAAKTETAEKTEKNGKFSNGTIDNFREQKEIDRKKAFFQALKEDVQRAQKAREKLLFEEEINDIVTNLPTEQKNRLLHYQASYKDRSIYQRAELRKKLIEEQKKAEEKEKTASIPSPAKQVSAIEGAFEGKSGTQGGGTANLSAQAVG